MHAIDAPRSNAGGQRLIRLLFVTTFALLAPVAKSQGIPQLPQIPAFLPTLDQVVATQAMPIDGTWLIPSIGKKIRIEAGRAYAVDPWLHLFVLQIQPGMVVIRNIAPTAPGTYSGEDLPLMGTFNARVQPDRALAVSVATLVGPINYKLVPMQLDNPQWFAQEMQASGVGGAAPGAPSAPGYQPTPPPGTPVAPPPVVRPPEPLPAPVDTLAEPPPPPADCTPIDIDPDTGLTICA